MKYKFILSTLLALSLNSIKAQITIVNNDLPAANDTFRVSIGDIMQPNIDPTPFGAGITWDFSALIPVSQNVDSFIDEASTNGLLPVFFIDLAINPNRANMANRGSVFAGLPAIPGLPITDIYNFYYKTSSVFRQAGIGATLQGTQVPLTYSDLDIIYNLPLHYNDVDSDDASANISLTGIGYYGFTQHRVNSVEGWGTVITPYGSFDALKVKSVITAHDTLFLDTLGLGGFSFDRPAVTEYKWLADGEGIPVLQINMTDNGIGGTDVSSIVYKDSIRILATGIDDISISENSIQVYPNPTSNLSLFTFELNQQADVKITLFDISGKLIQVLDNKPMQKGIQNLIIDKSRYNLQQGIYLIQLLVNGNPMYAKLIVSN